MCTSHNGRDQHSIYSILAQLICYLKYDNVQGRKLSITDDVLPVYSVMYPSRGNLKRRFIEFCAL